jgi:SAM-dependent methyltransferase
MPGMLASMLYRIDRYFPRPRVEGRESSEAYSDWEHRTGRALISRHKEYLGDLEGKKILDIGCGLGGKTLVYAEAGGDVTGVDLDPAHCSGAVDYARGSGFPMNVVCGDATLLPFSDSSFDMVIANDSMEHFHDPASALNELVRVVRTGGLVFLFFTPWGSPLGSHLYDHIKTPWCHILFSEKILEDMLCLAFAEEGREDPAGDAGSAMDDYRSENNRIDISGYRKIIRSVGTIAVEKEELIPPKFEFLRPLTRFPWIREYFTGTVVSFLRKK